MATPVVSGSSRSASQRSHGGARGTDGVSERGVAAAGIAGALAVTFALFAGGARRFAARAALVLGGAPAVAATVIAIAIVQSAVAMLCLRSRLPSRRFYRAAGVHEAKLTPM